MTESESIKPYDRLIGKRVIGIIDRTHGFTLIFEDTLRLRVEIEEDGGMKITVQYPNEKSRA